MTHILHAQDTNSAQGAARADTDIFGELLEVSKKVGPLSDWTDFDEAVKPAVAEVYRAAVAGDEWVFGSFEENSVESELSYGAFVIGWDKAFELIGRALGVDPQALSYAISAGGVGLNHLSAADLETLKKIKAKEPRELYDLIEAAFPR